MIATSGAAPIEPVSAIEARSFPVDRIPATLAGHRDGAVFATHHAGHSGWTHDRDGRMEEDDMTGESALLTIAEVAVAFAGFASVVTVFRRRDDEGWPGQDLIRFQLMITTSLAVVFFALLPFAVHFFEASEHATWAGSSFALASFMIVLMLTAGRRVIALTRDAALNPHISLSFIALGILIALAQALNGFGLLFDRSLGPYFVGLLYLLVISGFSFARMLPTGFGADSN